MLKSPERYACPQFSFITSTYLLKQCALERDILKNDSSKICTLAKKKKKNHVKDVTHHLIEQSTLQLRTHNPLLHRDSMITKHYFMALLGYLER